MLIYPFLFCVLFLIVSFAVMAFRLRKPSRQYEGPASVAKVYDEWTVDPKMNYYWGNHLHAGYYGLPPEAKDFVRAKVDMIDELVTWGIAQPDPALFERLEHPAPGSKPVQILDVGCGVGGTATYLAQRWPKSAQITAFTLSRAQASFAVARARSLGLENVFFLECDAMNHAFAPHSFDIAMSLESEIHMPDKERFLNEILRTLKQGGRVVTATWNVRDRASNPLTVAEKEHVQYLVNEWCHTTFDSIPESLQLYERLGLQDVVAADWTTATLPSWREAVLVALRDGRGLLRTDPRRYWGNIRDAYTILQYDSAFRKRLCVYGLFRGRKPAELPIQH
jgi:MPBQ/MSBQ methyltransferase